MNIHELKMKKMQGVLSLENLLKQIQEEQQKDKFNLCVSEYKQMKKTLDKLKELDEEIKNLESSQT